MMRCATTPTLKQFSIQLLLAGFLWFFALSCVSNATEQINATAGQSPNTFEQSVETGEMITDTHLAIQLFLASSISSSPNEPKYNCFESLANTLAQLSQIQVSSQEASRSGAQVGELAQQFKKNGIGVTLLTSHWSAPKNNERDALANYRGYEITLNRFRYLDEIPPPGAVPFAEQICGGDGCQREQLLLRALQQRYDTSRNSNARAARPFGPRNVALRVAASRDPEGYNSIPSVVNLENGITICTDIYSIRLGQSASVEINGEYVPTRNRHNIVDDLSRTQCFHRRIGLDDTSIPHPATMQPSPCVRYLIVNKFIIANRVQYSDCFFQQGEIGLDEGLMTAVCALVSLNVHGENLGNLLHFNSLRFFRLTEHALAKVASQISGAKQ